MPPWRKRCSASASSASGVSSRSSAVFRKVVLSSRIQPWMQLRISSSGRCWPAMRKAASVVPASASRLVFGRGRLSVADVLVGGRALRDGLAQQALRLFEAVPAQVVDHLAPEPRQQRVVGLAQELEHDPPFGLLGGARRLLREDALQLSARDEVADALGDRVEELALLGEERSLVGARHRLGVVDLDLADGLVLHLDRRGHPVGRGLEARGREGAVAEHDPRHADDRGTASPRAACVPDPRARRRRASPRGRAARRHGRGVFSSFARSCRSWRMRSIGLSAVISPRAGPRRRAAGGRPPWRRAARGCARAGRVRCGPRSPVARASPSLRRVRGRARR